MQTPCLTSPLLPGRALRNWLAQVPQRAAGATPSQACLSRMETRFLEPVEAATFQGSQAVSLPAQDWPQPKDPLVLAGCNELE